MDIDCVNKDYSTLKLKADHRNRPMYVCGDGYIYLETFGPFYKQAYDFCIAISEPVSRPKHIHEYRMTPYSLYAAVSVGLTGDDIIKTLNILSKNQITPSLTKKIYDETSKCGEVKLVLKKGRYFLESFNKDCLLKLLEYEDIISAKINPDITLSTSNRLRKSGTDVLVDDCPLQIEAAFLNKGQHSPDKLFLIEINPDYSEKVKKSCRDAGYPSLEEYDFRNDTKTPQLGIRVKCETTIRPYQQKSLGRILGNGRARSGIIVLPCGAGKTLVGVSAACTIDKSVIVLATTGVSCQQWKSQFIKWTSLSADGAGPTCVRLFISSQKETFSAEEPCVLITTYAMMAYTQRRSKESSEIIKLIKGREWGLLILDEVHVAPAEMFRKCLSVTKSKCKLGLTATLLREDEKIEDLFFLIGPKLYEADWLGLQRDRFLAVVECIEVWCPMSPVFLREYLKQKSINRKTLLQTMNPNKFRNCQHLIEYHEAKNDKIMIFSDNIYALKKYAVLLGKPFIYGKTSDTERMLTLDALQNNPSMNTIFISKIGDCSIDLPDVNVIIQISSHFSSRRQEAQRLGRILRPKSKSESKAYFYTLVSQDTDECYYAARRQRFLVDQGYSFNVKRSLTSERESKYMFSSLESVKGLLKEVMDTSESFGTIESDIEELEGGKTNKSDEKNGKKKTRGKKEKHKFKSDKIKKIKEGILRKRKMHEIMMIEGEKEFRE